ncbi:MAG: hypothetical protein RL328_180 [Acidobacteriota bacterium]
MNWIEAGFWVCLWTVIALCIGSVIWWGIKSTGSGGGQ